MDWNTLLVLLGTVGGLLGLDRWRGARRARTEEVLRIARKLAGLVVAGAAAAGKPAAASSIALWTERFEAALAAAGLTISDAQRRGAVEAALDEVRRLGHVALEGQLARLAVEADGFAERLEQQLAKLGPRRGR